MLWHSCTCCENMEQKLRGGGGKLFQPGGCGEKLSWGVQHKAGQRGRNVGSSRTIQHQHNSVKRQKAPRKALWTMAHKRPLVLQGGFFTISSFHAHPWLWVLRCTAPSAPSRPSLCTQHVKLDASPGLAGTQGSPVALSGWQGCGSGCVLGAQRWELQQTPPLLWWCGTAKVFSKLLLPAAPTPFPANSSR